MPRNNRRLMLECLEGRAVPAAVVRSAAGADAAAIQATVDQFRTDLGGSNNGATIGSFETGRREINWDGVPDSKSAPNNLPADFFNVNSPRGVVFTTGGTGFQVSADSDNPTDTPVEFGNLHAGYPGIFQTFSAQRLFTPLGSNFMTVNFFVPGTKIPATVSGFGVVFADVDNQDKRAALQFVDAKDKSLGLFTAQPMGNGLSFLGVSFDAGERVASVTIRTGNAIIGVEDKDAAADVAVMDDFIYGEPQAIAPTFDFGDAPDSYGTTLAKDGARSLAVGIHLGATRDTEPDGQPTADATGDGADEDGVTFLTPLVPGREFKVNFTVTNPINSNGGFVNLFVDWNQDGDFADTGEVVLINGTSFPGQDNIFTRTVPADAKPGVTFARAIVTHQSLPGTPTATGYQPNGEVEDYRITILPTVSLSNETVGEFRPTGTVVGVLDGVPGLGHTYEFALVDGKGAENNALFSIVGNKLVTARPFDFSNTPFLTVRVRATDETTAFDERAIAIAVLDAPNIARVDKGLNVAGTGKDDTFFFAAKGDEHEFSLNGEIFAFRKADIDVIAFHGSGGMDTAVLFGSGADNTAGLGANFGVLKGAGFEVWASGTTNLGAVAGGPNGVAFLAGTAGKETFAAAPGSATMAAAGFNNTAAGFTNAAGYSNGGAEDVAFLGGSAGDDTFVGNPTYSQIAGAGFFSIAEGFRFVGAFSNGGNDVAFFGDSAGDDTFVGRPTDAEMAGAVYYVGAVGFKNVAAYATNGGNDAAFLEDTAGNDFLVAGGFAAELTSAVHFIRVEGFDGVRVFGTNGGVNKKQVGVLGYFLDTPGFTV